MYSYEYREQAGDVVMEVPSEVMLSARFGPARGALSTGADVSLLLDGLRDNETLQLATALLFQRMDPGELAPHRTLSHTF